MEVAFVGKENAVFGEYSPQKHGYWEIIYNRSGSGKLVAGAESFDFYPGDIAIVPPLVEHFRSTEEGEEGSEDFSLFFRSFRTIGNHPFRILHDDERQTVAQLMDIAAYHHNIANVYERAILHSLGDLLYQTLVKIYSYSQNHDSRIEGVIEDMYNNISNADYDLSDMIKKSGYCKGYFRKLFKEFTKQSPIEYMQNIRINYARSLMNQFGPSRNITDIANSSGFNDPLYFSRVFKKINGLSPREYQNKQFHYDANEEA